MSVQAVPITTCALGVWQFRRRHWKLGLIETLEKRTSAEPLTLDELCVLKNTFLRMPLPFRLSLDADEREYRTIEVTGTFDHTREILLTPRSLHPLHADDELSVPPHVLTVCS